MTEMFQRILQGGLTRDEARRERKEEQGGPQRPRPFIFIRASERIVQSSGFSSRRAMFREMS